MSTRVRSRSGPFRAAVAVGLVMAVLPAAGACQPEAAQADQVAATVPADTARLVAAPGVRDPAFAVLLGFVLDHHTGGLDGARVQAAVEAAGRPSSMPYQMVRLLARLPERAGGAASTAHVELLLDRDLDLPVPYKILIYHPGSFLGSSHIRFRELGIGRQIIPHHPKDRDVAPEPPFAIESVHLYILEQGHLEIDVDGWLDALAGDKIDDTRVAALVIYRRNALLYGLALGYNRRGEPRSGTLSFADDRVLYPSPPEVRAVTVEMRRVLERYAPSIGERFRNW